MDRETFSTLVLQSTDSLYRVAKGILKQDADCEDAVQEAIARAFASLPALKQDRYAKTWLTRILINECYKILRGGSRLDLCEEPKEEKESAAENYRELYQALLCLDDKYRVTLVLHYLEGYSVTEIAGLMRTTEGTVKSRLHRGRESLRQILEEEDCHGIERKGC